MSKEVVKKVQKNKAWTTIHGEDSTRIEAIQVGQDVLMQVWNGKTSSLVVVANKRICQRGEKATVREF